LAFGLFDQPFLLAKDEQFFSPKKWKKKKKKKKIKKGTINLSILIGFHLSRFLLNQPHDDAICSLIPCHAKRRNSSRVVIFKGWTNAANHLIAFTAHACIEVPRFRRPGTCMGH